MKHHGRLFFRSANAWYESIIPLAGVLLLFCVLTSMWVRDADAQHDPTSDVDEASPSAHSPSPADGLPSRESLKNFLLQAYPRLIDSSFKDSSAAAPGILAQFMSYQCSPYNETSAQVAALDEKERLEKRKIGLNLRGYYRDSPYTSVSGDDTGADELMEDSDSRIGVSWDLIDGGLLEQRSRAREIARLRDIAQLSEGARRLLDLYPCRDTLLMYHFGRLRLGLLTEKAAALDFLLPFARESYFSGSGYLDSVYDIEEELRKTRASIENLRVQAQSAGRFAGTADVIPGAPLVDLDLESILRAIEKDSHMERTLEIEESVLRERNAFLYNVDLELFADYGATRSPRTDSGDREKMRLGLNVKVPLHLPENTYVDKEIHRLRQNYGSRKETLLLDAFRRYHAYREKLNDALRMHYRELLVRERLRRTMLNMEKEQFLSNAPLTQDIAFALGKQVLELIDIQVEDLAVRESLYRQILFLLSQAGLAYDPAFFKPVNLEVSGTRGRMGQRAAYIWSDAFGRLDNKTILDFFEAKAISTAIVSAGKKTEKEKLRDFLHAAEQKHVAVELLVGNNDWLFPRKRTDMPVEVSRLYGLAETLHLDIEPQAMPDYKDRRSGYWEDYVEMVEEIATLKRAGSKLAIALPPRPEGDALRRLSAMADHIYVMAYAITKPEAMKKALERFADVPVEKLAVALRPADFSDENQLETFIDQVMAQTGVSRFAFHRIEDYISLTGQRRAQ